jgi:hypothetical protein
VLKGWKGLLLSIIMEESPLGKLKTEVTKNETIVSNEFEMAVFMHFI